MGYRGTVVQCCLVVACNLQMLNRLAPSLKSMVTPAGAAIIQTRKMLNMTGASAQPGLTQKGSDHSGHHPGMKLSRDGKKLGWAAMFLQHLSQQGPAHCIKRLQEV